MKVFLVISIMVLFLVYGCSDDSDDTGSTPPDSTFISEVVSDCKPILWKELESRCWRIKMEYLSGNYRLTLVFESPGNPMGSKTVMLDGSGFDGVLREGLRKVSAEQ